MNKAELQNLVIDYAYGYGIDPRIALAQIERESGWRQDVAYGPFVGGSGEKGISQFTPGTWARFGNGDHNNAYDPDYAMTAWGAYMQWLLDRYNWDYAKALMGYNGGEGNVDKGAVSTRAQEYARAILANAGYQNVSYDTIASSPNSPSSDFPYTALLIGGIGLLLVFALRK